MLAPSRRDAGLRRLRVANRVVIGVAVGLTGLFADFAAKAFPGHARHAAAGAVRRSSRPRHHTPAHHGSHRLAPPATTPAAAPPASPAPSHPGPVDAGTLPSPGPVDAGTLPSPGPVDAGALPVAGPVGTRTRADTRAGRVGWVVTTIAAPDALATYTWRALGTTAVLRVTDRHAHAVRQAVQRELDAIDLAASRFRAESELTRLCRAGGRPIPVSPLLLEAIRLSIRAAAITGGVVDPTLGDRLVATGYDRDFSMLSPAPATAALPWRLPRVLVRRRELWQEIIAVGRPSDGPAAAGHPA